MAASFSLGVADADQYRIRLAGALISNGAGASGYADGEFLKISWRNDVTIEVEGTDGYVVRSKRLTRLVDIELSFLQSAPNNPFLSGLFALLQNTPNGGDVGSFVMQNLQGVDLVSCSKCWIRKPADLVLDRSATPRKWQLSAMAEVFLIG